MARPSAHRTPSAAQIERARQVNEEFDLFFGSIDLVLAHEAAILACDEYFFCRPAFSGYGQYTAKPLPLGVMLLGWRLGILREQCCAKNAWLIFFAGGSASTTWRRGYCPDCQKSERRYGYEVCVEKIRFCMDICEQVRDWVEVVEIEHFPSQTFSFAEPAIAPCYAGKIRKVRKLLVEAATVAQLITELRTGNVRPPTAREKSLVPDKLTWKVGNAEQKAYQII